MLSPLYGQLSPLRVPTKAVRQVQDSDALAYIAAVETADGQALEDSVKYAYEDFILGCKGDGIWSAIKASCILAGARTLPGALVPLVGSSPTNYNFVSADYDRKNGVIGNGSTKYIDTNRNNNADPQDSQHLSVYRKSTGSGPLLSMLNSNVSGASHIGGTTSLATRSRNSTTFPFTGNTGFIGINRNSSSEYIYRRNFVNTTAIQVSQFPQNSNISIFRTNTVYGTHRLSFYSIGESLDLAALDSRVSTLMTDLAAAIP
jgi:hypothetical protein